MRERSTSPKTPPQTKTASAPGPTPRASAARTAKQRASTSTPPKATELENQARAREKRFELRRAPSPRVGLGVPRRWTIQMTHEQVAAALRRAPLLRIWLSRNADEMWARAEGAYPDKTLDRRLLHAFAVLAAMPHDLGYPAGPGYVSTDSLADELQIPRPTVERVLRTLAVLGVTERHDTNKATYRIVE